VGLWGAVWMGLGSILGTGVFVSLGVVSGIAGDGLIIAVAVAALVAVANGLSSAQLAAAHPVSGGTYEYAYIWIYPSAGFLAGWLFLAAKMASAATAALGCAAYALHTLDLAHSGTTRAILACSIALATTWLVATGIRRSHRANVVIVTATLTALAAFVLSGAVSTAPFSIHALFPPHAWRGHLAAPEPLLYGTALMFVAYTGYGRVATLGEEIRDPRRNIPRAIVLTLAISMAIYLAVAAVAINAVGPAVFGQMTEEAAAPLESVARTFTSPYAGKIVALGAITAMAGVLLNLILGLSRVALAMARRGDLPAGLGRVDDAHQSPTRAVWTVGLLIAAFSLSGDLHITWTFSALTVLVYYGITNLAALRLPAEHRRFPTWVAWSGLISCLLLTVFIPPLIWVAGAGVVVSGFVLRWALRRSARAS